MIRALAEYLAAHATAHREGRKVVIPGGWVASPSPETARNAAEAVKARA